MFSVGFLTDPVIVSPCSLICEELDQPKTEEEQEDTMENENKKEAGERRKMRGNSKRPVQFITKGAKGSDMRLFIAR